ncbi:MAG: quinone-dependent dihydroorotate dehydrogenase [Steroidobacteraceae bacterium]
MRQRAASLLAGAAMPILSLFEPERAHDLGLAGLRACRNLWPGVQIPAALGVRCLGLQFAHPLGLAAGFDKNGDYLDALGAMGFSHIELGTVTPRAQPGNPQPRMFRVPAREALVNRMGFNNKGVDHLVARLRMNRYTGVRGISIGKNADTPIAEAERDYVTCLQRVYAHADYVAINVSSPNTARLRELQAGDGLQRIVGALLEERERLAGREGRRVPLLVKVAPDLDDGQIASIAATLRSLAVDGVIATNTSTDLNCLGSGWPASRQGGLSGAPLHTLSLNVISQLRAALGAEYPIIGVGGIVSVERALASLRAGATLLQIYTGFAIQGYRLVDAILTALSAQCRVAPP